MKHAIMIMAHANYEGLCQLIKLLDNSHIDIFLHINSSSLDWDDNIVAGITNESKVIIVPRIKVTYCNYSQVEAIKSLLSTALKGHYDYYHIISGADLPLHSPAEFNEFFECHNGSEFVNFNPRYDVTRAGYWFFFANAIRTSSGIRQRLLIYTHKVLLNIQKILKVNFAKGFNGTIHKGADWWSITHAAAEYVIENEPIFRKFFRRTYCPSELLVQTLLYNSHFKAKIYSLEYNPMAALREIDWQRGTPYVWRNSDFDYLINSDCMFARKFDVNIDNEIIQRIINHIKQK